MRFKCEQTVLLRKRMDGTLENLLRITVEDAGNEAVTLLADDTEILCVPTDNRILVEYWIEEPQAEQVLVVSIKKNGEIYQESFKLRKPRHWEFHLVQMSHHDPGYTDLMSHVFQRHYEWLDRVLDDMDARQDYPEDTRLRIAIEQFWSLEYFLDHAPGERVEKLIKYIKRGDIELTALYANLITEQLGHEECYRAFYPAQEFAKKCGVKITCATHNDIPGVSWGLCRVLCDAGIEMFLPDFPNYYNWGHGDLDSFWNMRDIFGYEGPGACYWKSPDQKRVLMWHGNDNMTCCWDAAWMEHVLGKLEASDYPYEIYRSTVHGGNVDNQGFIAAYADCGTKWNETYAFPHVVCSTNQLFKEAFVQYAQEKKIAIPEVCGEIPGQDYPVAAMSMAEVTAAARRTHPVTAAAEKLLTLVEEDEVVYDQTHLLKETYRDLLLADDHAYGYHFPAGPAMRGAYWEKGSYAMRAQANAHDLLDKALASVADRIAPMDTALRMVVFNPSGLAGSRAVETSMREFDNCGTIIRESNGDPNFLKGYILNNRRRVNPEERFWEEGKFKLVDMESRKQVPFYIETLKWDDPVAYAAESVGLGSGSRRYGFFEMPGGMRKILRFVAEDLPAFGYRCYALIPAEMSNTAAEPIPVKTIENGIYRIETDERGISSIQDVRCGKELLDSFCPYRLGELLVRNFDRPDVEKMQITSVKAMQNEIFGTVDLEAQIDGAYGVRVKLTVWQGLEVLNLSVRLVFNAKPLQTMFAAFPFKGNGFRYGAMLSEQETAKNIMPGAHSDFITVGDYVSVKESDMLWSSQDTAVVALSHLWDGYTSPAHSCLFTGENHKRLTEEDFDTGWIFALLASNNYGTNFMCSQVFDEVYNFSFGCSAGKDDTVNSFWGEREQNRVRTQFTDRSRGNMPPAASMLDTGRLQCLVLKKAEDKKGYIARLWNHSEAEEKISLWMNGKQITEYEVCDALERRIKDPDNGFVSAGSVVTIRFEGQNKV